jgi:dTDP-4-amino-4,6-dideoxygalactose transaminase
MDAIMDIAARHGLTVIEDCAQAAGARYRGRRVGSIGHAGCFSFYPTKNLGAIGDAGIVVTGDGDLADRIRKLRQYGWDKERNSSLDGVNTRLDELQAAILRAKLPSLDADNALRRKIADVYAQALAVSDLALPSTPESRYHVYHLYVVRSENRDGMLEALRRSGVVAGIHYPIPVHLQRAFQGRGFNPWPLPHTNRVSAQVLSLPIYPELAHRDVNTVVEAVLAFAAFERVNARL